MKIQFTVDPDNIVAFAEILYNEDLKNEITGTTEDDCLLIDVHYNRDKRDAIESLEELSESED